MKYSHRHPLVFLFFVMTFTVILAGPAQAAFLLHHPAFTGTIIDTTGHFPGTALQVKVHWEWRRFSGGYEPHPGIRDALLEVGADGTFRVPAFTQANPLPLWRAMVVAQFVKKGVHANGPAEDFVLGGASATTQEHGTAAGEHFMKDLSCMYIMCARRHVGHFRFTTGRTARAELGNRVLDVEVTRTYRDPVSGRTTQYGHLYRSLDATAGGDLDIPQNGLAVCGVPGHTPELSAHIRVREFQTGKVLLDRDLPATTEDALGSSLRDLVINE